VVGCCCNMVVDSESHIGVSKNGNRRQVTCVMACIRQGGHCTVERVWSAIQHSVHDLTALSLVGVFYHVLGQQSDAISLERSGLAILFVSDMDSRHLGMFCLFDSGFTKCLARASRSLPRPPPHLLCSSVVIAVRFAQFARIERCPSWLVWTGLEPIRRAPLWSGSVLNSLLDWSAIVPAVVPATFLFRCCDVAVLSQSALNSA